MITQEQITELRQKRKDNEKSVQAAIERQMAFDEQIRNAVVDFIKQERLLQQTTWRLTNSGGYLALWADGEIKHSVLEEAQEGWHCASHQLSNGARLMLDDNQYSIRVDEVSQLRPLIEEYGLVLSNNEIDQELEELEQRKSELMALKAALDLDKPKEFVRETKVMEIPGGGFIKHGTE